LTEITKILEPLTPKVFDKNELYVFGIIILCWCTLIVIHRLEPLLLRTEIIALYVFNVWFATVGDRILAEPPVDYYDTLDYPHGELFDSILQIGVYPVPIVIFFHFYQKYKPGKAAYVLIYALILVMLEWISKNFFDVFHFKEWTSYYSYVFYCFALSVNLIFFGLIKIYLK
jgi:hypothetical protein